MILNNQKIISPKIKIPHILKDKVKIFSNCNLNINEIQLFQISLQLVANYLNHKNFTLNDYYCLNIFFTENGIISFHDESNKVNGMQIYMAIYKMKNLREKNMSTFSMFVYIEELAHYFLRISDETKIKYKVIEIMKELIPSFSINDVKGWGLNGL